jgi:hypothetical protein
MRIWKSAAAALLVLATAGFAVPAAAQWSTKQRTEFVNDCLSACRKNPRVPEAQRPQCDEYCLCVVTEGQKLFNEAQYDQLTKDFAAKRQTAEVKQLQELAPACNRKAFAPR